jgi:hypothetical protein
MATLFQEDCTRAQTWVLTLTRATPMDMTRLCCWAMSNNALFGMHVVSGTMLLAMAKPETQQHMLDKLRNLIEQAGGDRTALAAVKPLDVYHLEEWGCIEPYKTPKQPAVEVSDIIRSPSESESEDEEPPAEKKEPEEPDDWGCGGLQRPHPGNQFRVGGGCEACGAGPP